MPRLVPFCLLPLLVACSGARAFPRARAALPAEGTLAVVGVPAPWYAPNGLIAGRFRAAVPEYESIDGLETKAFVISDRRLYGGLYFWPEPARATAFFDDEWRAGVRERRGTDPELALYAVTAVVDGELGVGGDPVGTRSLAAPLVASLSTWRDGQPPPPPSSGGLLRAFVLRDGARVGVAALWTDWASARRSVASLVPAGAADSRTTYFDAPVVVDETLRRAADAR